MKNGQFSIGKKTKHIRSKFFFIKDRIDSREIRVVHCPTKEMWVDMLTKPLLGKAFRVMQSKLMNCSEEYKDSETNDKNNAQAKDAGKQARQTSDWKNDLAGSHPDTAGVCWGIATPGNKQMLTHNTQKIRKHQQESYFYKKPMRSNKI